MIIMRTSHHLIQHQQALALTAGNHFTEQLAIRPKMISIREPKCLLQIFIDSFRLRDRFLWSSDIVRQTASSICLLDLFRWLSFGESVMEPVFFLGRLIFPLQLSFFLSWDFWVMLWDWILYFYSPVVLFFHSFVNLHKGIV